MTSYRFDDFVFDLDSQQLTRSGEDVPIRPKTAELLTVLLENHDRLLSKQELMDEVWHDTHVGEAVLFQTISDLRKVLGKREDGSSYIENIKRRGYAFTGNPTPVSNTDTADAEPEPIIQPVTHEMPSPVDAAAGAPPQFTHPAPMAQVDPVIQNRSVGFPFRNLMFVAMALLVVGSLWFFRETEHEPVQTSFQEEYAKPRLFLGLRIEADPAADWSAEAWQTLQETMINSQRRVEMEGMEDNSRFWPATPEERQALAMRLGELHGTPFTGLLHAAPNDEGLLVELELYRGDQLVASRQNHTDHPTTAISWSAGQIRNFFDDYKANWDTAVRFAPDAETLDLFTNILHDLHDGRFEVAKNQLRELHRRRPAHPWATLLEARTAYLSGDLEKGMELTDSIDLENADLYFKFEIWRNYADMANKRAEPLKALEYEEKGLAAAQLLEDEYLEAESYKHQGVTLVVLGRYEEAALVLERCMNILIKNGWTAGLPQIYQNLGNTYLSRGNLAEAVSHYRRSIQLWEGMDQEESLAGPMVNLGLCLQKLGNEEQAEMWLKRAVDNSKHANRRAVRGQAMINLSALYLGQDRFEEAEPLLLEGLEIAREEAEKDIETLLIYNLAVLYYYTDQLEKAGQYADIAKAEKGEYQGDAYLISGLIHQKLEEWEHAVENMEKAKILMTDLWTEEEEKELRTAKKKAGH